MVRIRKGLIAFYSIAVITGVVACGKKSKKEKVDSGNVKSEIQTNIDSSAATQELLNIDIEFSNNSIKNGINEAFVHYIDDEGVLLRPNHNPIVGKDSVVKLLSNKKSGNITMQWNPSYAYVAKSGELGYTYGIYELSGTGPMGKPVKSLGTYVSIWKKDASGNWKIALDSGNEGLVPIKKTRKPK